MNIKKCYCSLNDSQYIKHLANLPDLVDVHRVDDTPRRAPFGVGTEATVPTVNLVTPPYPPNTESRSTQACTAGPAQGLE